MRPGTGVSREALRTNNGLDLVEIVELAVRAGDSLENRRWVGDIGGKNCGARVITAAHRST